MPIQYSSVVVTDFDFPLLSEILNETFEISKVEMKYLKDRVTPYRTSSKVLLTQLEAIKKAIEEKGDTVVVTLRQRKNYFTFE